MTKLDKFQGVATSVIRHTSGMIVGRYHNTSVAEVMGSNVRLDTGGYFTRTTKVRMNQFANQFCGGAFYVYQKKGDWFVKIGDREPILFCGRTCEFDI